ncbi:helix-turn-helix domain-containing protein [Carnobacterium divergens]|uniref:helix-turn-helix domain-containing protein n=1 Tax=Carnobacterium divergens TaxID=2748 RepID=UPI00288EA02D|nr:helix-turn-helix domain-containing protein [Carnobacterium divergens]MDT1995933.1 helix-turn-helix domain-containing protein [Carnobacterium divergens]
MSIFLSKADTRKLLLLHIIEESFQQQITISELKKRMEVSEFIVISAYEELKEDIKNYRLSDQIAIQKFNKILKIKRTMNFSSKSLRSIYIQRSLNFQIIEDIFEEKFSNPSDYAERFYISRTKVYTQITGIKKTIKKI